MASNEHATEWIPRPHLAAITLAIAVVFLMPQTASANQPLPGPAPMSPTSGQTIDAGSVLTFEVRPVDGATGYLWGFFQNGQAVWENYANERVLSGTTYTIAPGSAAHQAIKPGALQIWVRGLVGGQWTDATIIDVTVVAGAVRPRPCPTITFYGLRGSGEPAYPGEENMGSLAFDTYGQFVQRANHAGVRIIPDGVTAYPAVPVQDWFKEDLLDEFVVNREFSSVKLGAASLEAKVTETSTADPSMCYIFVGYSQGSWVIGEYFASASGNALVNSGRIAGVVLYADPLFDPTYPEALGDEYPGIARARNLTSVGKSPYVPQPLKGKVRSYCLTNDIVCNYPHGGIGPHLDYRHSTSHLPMSDSGASFLGELILGLP
jgi:hypothetical protein